MRVVLDTNILTRAAKPQNDGPAFQVLQLLLEPTHVICTSPLLLDELGRVLRYPRLQRLHGLSDPEIEAFVLAFQTAASVIPLADHQVRTVVHADPKDDPVIATAVHGKASLVCTLDRHLFNVEVLRFCSEHDISVVSDVELLRMLRDPEQNP